MKTKAESAVSGATDVTPAVNPLQRRMKMSGTNEAANKAALAELNKRANAIFIESEKYENELRETLDDRDEPVFFYDLAHNLNDYDPDWGSGLPAYLISSVKLTSDQIVALLIEAGHYKPEEEAVK